MAQNEAITQERRRASVAFSGGGSFLDAVVVGSS
jgi:hypothetical protein